MSRLIVDNRSLTVAAPIGDCGGDVRKLLGCAAAILLMCPAALHPAGAVDANTLDNKVLIGYQGWFTCPSDSSQRWTHWSRGVPSAETLTVELYPDLSELTPMSAARFRG